MSNGHDEGKEEKHTPEQLLNLYPALTKLLAYISGSEKVAITLAMEEYSREQLAKERELRKELVEVAKAYLSKIYNEDLQKKIKALLKVAEENAPRANEDGGNGT